MSLGADYFEGVYSDGPDPWGFRDRWYEERKRAVTLAVLPEQRYATAFEPGCAIGVLTERLAERCDALLAMDVNPTALAEATRRMSGQPHVRLVQGGIPGDWPVGGFDLVVLSEVGYYLAGADLERLGERSVEALTPGATLLACHWRHEVSDYPTSGDAVHDMLADHAAAAGLQRLSHHLEEDFVLDVWSGDGRSVARRTGLKG